MTDGAVRLRPADGNLAAVERLLSTAGLPTADVRDGPARFWVARRDGERLGVGGLERPGDAALLRSVAVEPSARGEGVGTAICAALESEARAAGAEAAYLLTTTAAGFFAARGYEPVARETVPAAVRETRQFAALCPDEAVAMRKPL